MLPFLFIMLLTLCVSNILSSFNAIICQQFFSPSMYVDIYALHYQFLLVLFRNGKKIFTPYVSIVVYWNWKIWSNNINQWCMKSEKKQNYNERMEWERTSLIAVSFFGHKRIITTKPDRHTLEWCLQYLLAVKVAMWLPFCSMSLLCCFNVVAMLLDRYIDNIPMCADR